MSEVTLESLAQELKDLHQEVEVYHRTARKLDQHVEEFKNSNSSRRGLEGGRGPEGKAGRDAVLVVRTDSGNNTVHVFDEGGNEKAILISVPGKDGHNGIDGKDGRNGADGKSGKDGRDGVSVHGKDGIPGRDGKDGKDAPVLSTIVKAVIEEMKSHWAKY